MTAIIHIACSKAEPGTLAQCLGRNQVTAIHLSLCERMGEEGGEVTVMLVMLLQEFPYIYVYAHIYVCVWLKPQVFEMFLEEGSLRPVECLLWK